VLSEACDAALCKAGRVLMLARELETSSSAAAQQQVKIAS
jgi:hypothetical protein